jgi:hypothetical protein
LEAQWTWRALERAEASAGRSKPASKAMTAMTTKSSMSVKALPRPPWSESFMGV